MNSFWQSAICWCTHFSDKCKRLQNVRNIIFCFPCFHTSRWRQKTSLQVVCRCLNSDVLELSVIAFAFVTFRQLNDDTHGRVRRLSADFVLFVQLFVRAATVARNMQSDNKFRKPHIHRCGFKRLNDDTHHCSNLVCVLTLGRRACDEL